MFNYESFCEEYRQYLLNVLEISKNSADKSYIPYLKNKRFKEQLNQAASAAVGKNDFYSAFYEGNKSDKQRLIDISDGFVNPKHPDITKKTASNYGSYKNAFYSFLEDIIKNTPDDKSATPVDEYPDFELDSKAMVKRFISRFKTQDRVYEQIMFPCRVFGKLFPKKEYKELLVDACNRISFIIDNSGNTISFKNIKSLFVNNHAVYLLGNNGNQYSALTECFDDNKKSKGYFPYPKPSFRNLSIDHKNSLNGTMINNSFPKLKELTNTIKQLEKQYGAYSFKTAPAIGDHLKNTLDANSKAELFLEVKKIYEDTSFVMMDQGENSRKNNSI